MSEYPIISSSWKAQGQPSMYVAELGMSLDNPKRDYFANESVVLGQYAAVWRVGDSVYEAVRDPLGIGKLFYTQTDEGELVFAQRFVELFQYKQPIYSVPAGKHVRFGAGGERELVRDLGAAIEVDPEFTVQSFDSDPQKVREFVELFKLRLKQVFSPLRELEREGWTVYVALSGGLDSTIMADYASQYLERPVACTLDLGKSEDSEKSEKIASHLGVEHVVFPTSQDEILQMLEDAPLACQDFRDFNVHCAVLNLLLAKNVRMLVEQDETVDPEKVIILTGDLMNEFTCDYAGEVIDGVEYYTLPRIGKKELQHYLVKGVETSDREVSPFDLYGLKCVQPYAVLYDLYMKLDESILQHEDPKKLLNSLFVDEEILSFIPKVKLRAQVGSRENMGILGLCHSLKLKNRDFRKKLLAKSGFPGGEIPIFVGKYDVEKFT